KCVVVIEVVAQKNPVQPGVHVFLETDRRGPLDGQLESAAAACPCSGRSITSGLPIVRVHGLVGPSKPSARTTFDRSPALRLSGSARLSRYVRAVERDRVRAPPRSQ